MTERTQDATPGPWFQNPRKPEEIVADGEPSVIARVPSARTGLYNRRAPANARLIAAAPDMLAALVEAEAHFGPFSEITVNGAHDPEDIRVVALIRAAIARAKGEQP